MQFILSPDKFEQDQEFIKLLERVGTLKCEYPPRLLVVRRATFMAQLNRWEMGISAHKLHSKDKFIQGRNR